MENRLIMLPQPILVSDEEIKEGDFYFKDGKILQWVKGTSVTYTHVHPSNYPKPIISGIEGLPKLDLSLIAKGIGWVDVEKMADEVYGDSMVGKGFWVEGFKAAQSLNEKKWTDDDMIDFQNFISSYPNRELKRGLTLPYYLEKFKQSRKPKEYLVEVEMEWGGKEYVDEQDAYGYDIKRPKITNNTIKVTKILK